MDERPNRQALLVVTGPPGAGKSTVARVLSERFEPSVLVEGDAFFGFLARGRVEPWLPESNTQNQVVIRASAAAAGSYADGGYFTVFDGMVGPWFLPAFVAASGRAQIDYAVLLPSVDQCVHRVETRTDHDFADHGATRKMHHEFSRSEIDQRHLFVDPPEGAEGLADLIVDALEDGRLAHRA